MNGLLRAKKALFVSVFSIITAISVAVTNNTYADTGININDIDRYLIETGEMPPLNTLIDKNFVNKAVDASYNGVQDSENRAINVYFVGAYRDKFKQVEMTYSDRDDASRSISAINITAHKNDVFYLEASYDFNKNVSSNKEDYKIAWYAKTDGGWVLVSDDNETAAKYIRARQCVKGSIVGDGGYPGPNYFVNTDGSKSEGDPIAVQNENVCEITAKTKGVAAVAYVVYVKTPLLDENNYKAVKSVVCNIAIEKTKITTATDDDEIEGEEHFKGNEVTTDTEISKEQFKQFNKLITKRGGRLFVTYSETEKKLTFSKDHNAAKKNKYGISYEYVGLAVSRLKVKSDTSTERILQGILSEKNNYFDNASGADVLDPYFELALKPADTYTDPNAKSYSTCGRSVLIYRWSYLDDDKITTSNDVSDVIKSNGGFSTDKASQGQVSLDIKGLLMNIGITPSDDDSGTITYSIGSDSSACDDTSWASSLLKMFAKLKSEDRDHIGHMYVGIDFIAHLKKGNSYNFYKKADGNADRKRNEANRWDNRYTEQGEGNLKTPLPDFPTVRKIDYHYDPDDSDVPICSMFSWYNWKVLKDYMAKTQRADNPITVPNDRVYMIADLHVTNRSSQKIEGVDAASVDAVRALTNVKIVKNKQQTSTRQALNYNLIANNVLFSDYDSLYGGRNLYPNVYASGSNEDITVDDDTTVTKLLINQRASGVNDSAPGIYVWNEALDTDGDGNYDYIIGADRDLLEYDNILGNNTITDTEAQVDAIRDAGAEDDGRLRSLLHKYSYDYTADKPTKNLWQNTVSDNNAIPAGENLKTTVQADTWYGSADIGVMKQMIDADVCNVNIYCKQLSVKWSYQYRHGPNYSWEVDDVERLKGRNKGKTHGEEYDFTWNTVDIETKDDSVKTDDNYGIHDFSWWRSHRDERNRQFIHKVTLYDYVYWSTETASGRTKKISGYAWESGCTQLPANSYGERHWCCNGHTATITTVYVASSSYDSTTVPAIETDDEDEGDEYAEEELKQKILCSFTSYSDQISEYETKKSKIETKIVSCNSIIDDEDSTEDEITDAEEKLEELEEELEGVNSTLEKLKEYKNTHVSIGKSRANGAHYHLLGEGSITYPDPLVIDGDGVPDRDRIKFANSAIKSGDDVVLYYRNRQNDKWETIEATEVIDGVAGFDYVNTEYSVETVSGDEVIYVDEPIILNDNVLLYRKNGPDSGSEDDSPSTGDDSLMISGSYIDYWNNIGASDDTAFSSTYPKKVGIGKAMKNEKGDYFDASTNLSYDNFGWYIKYRFCGVSYILNDLDIYGIDSWKTNYIRHDTDYGSGEGDVKGVIQEGDMFAGVQETDGGSDVSVVSEWLFNEDARPDDSETLWITKGVDGYDSSLDAAAENKEIGYYINTIDGRTLGNDPDADGKYIGQTLLKEQFQEYYDQSDCTWINSLQNYYKNHGLIVTCSTSGSRQGWKITDSMIGEIDKAINGEAEKAVYNGVPGTGGKHLYVRFHNDTFVLDGVEYLSDSTYNEGFKCDNGSATGEDHATLIYGSIKKGRKNIPDDAELQALYDLDHDGKADKYTNNPGFVITFNDVNKYSYSNFMLPSTGWDHNAWILNLKHINGALDETNLYSHQKFYSVMSRGLQPLYALDNTLTEQGGTQFINARCGDYFRHGNNGGHEDIGESLNWSAARTERIQDKGWITNWYGSNESLWQGCDTGYKDGVGWLGKASSSECMKYINTGTFSTLPDGHSSNIYGDGHKVRHYSNLGARSVIDWGYECEGNFPIIDVSAADEAKVYMATSEYVISEDHYGDVGGDGKITRLLKTKTDGTGKFEKNAYVRDDVEDTIALSQHSDFAEKGQIKIQNDVVTWPVVYSIPEDASNGYYYTSVSVTYKSVFCMYPNLNDSQRYNTITINNFNDSYAGLLSDPTRLKTTGEIPVGKTKLTGTPSTNYNKYKSEDYANRYGTQYLVNESYLSTGEMHNGYATAKRNKFLIKTMVDIKNNFPFMAYGENLSNESIAGGTMDSDGTNAIYRYAYRYSNLSDFVLRGDGLQNGQGWNRAIPTAYYANEPLRIHSVASAPVTIESDHENFKSTQIFNLPDMEYTNNSIRKFVQLSLDGTYTVDFDFDKYYSGLTGNHITTIEAQGMTDDEYNELELLHEYQKFQEKEEERFRTRYGNNGTVSTNYALDEDGDGYADIGYTKFLRDKEIRFPFPVEIDGVLYEVKNNKQGDEGAGDENQIYTDWISVGAATTSFTFHIPTWAQEGLYGLVRYKDGKIAKYTQSNPYKAWNAYEYPIEVRVLANNYSEEKGNTKEAKYKNEEYFNEKLSQYAATYAYSCSLTGVIYDFQTDSINNMSFDTKLTNDSYDIYNFVSHSDETKYLGEEDYERRVGKYNRFGREFVKKTLDGMFVDNSWPDFATLPFITGKHKNNAVNSNNVLMGNLSMGDEVGISVKTISTLLDDYCAVAENAVDIIPVYSYISPSGEEYAPEDIYIFYETDDGEFVEYKSVITEDDEIEAAAFDELRKGIVSGNSNRINSSNVLGSKFFEDCYYDFNHNTVDYTAKKNNLLYQQMLTRHNGDTSSFGYINVNNGHKLLTGDEAQLAENEEVSTNNAHIYGTSIKGISDSLAAVEGVVTLFNLNNYKDDDGTKVVAYKNQLNKMYQENLKDLENAINIAKHSKAYEGYYGQKVKEAMKTYVEYAEKCYKETTDIVDQDTGLVITGSLPLTYYGTNKITIDNGQDVAKRIDYYQLYMDSCFDKELTETQYEAFRNSMQTWYTTYKIPSKLYVCLRDDFDNYVNENGFNISLSKDNTKKLDYNTANYLSDEGLWIDYGYLKLNFQVITYTELKDREVTLSGVSTVITAEQYFKKIDDTCNALPNKYVYTDESGEKHYMVATMSYYLNEGGLDMWKLESVGEGEQTNAGYIKDDATGVRKQKDSRDEKNYEDTFISTLTLYNPWLKNDNIIDNPDMKKEMPVDYYSGDFAFIPLNASQDNRFSIGTLYIN